MPMPRGAGRATYPNVHNFTKIIDFKQAISIDSSAWVEDLYLLSYSDPAYPKNLGLDPGDDTWAQNAAFPKNYVKSLEVFELFNSRKNVNNFVNLEDALKLELGQILIRIRNTQSGSLNLDPDPVSEYRSNPDTATQNMDQQKKKNRSSSQI